MRAVLDTNAVVSGLLWHGAPRQVLDAAYTGKVELFTSAILLSELEEVLRREKFAWRLGLVGDTPQAMAVGYAALAALIEPVVIDPVILADPDDDDDDVLACAVAARAEAIVSGDSHLLGLKRYRDVRILSAAEFLARILT